jgi:hypothetical protein
MHGLLKNMPIMLRLTISISIILSKKRRIPHHISLPFKLIYKALFLPAYQLLLMDMLENLVQAEGLGKKIKKKKKILAKFYKVTYYHST